MFLERHQTLLEGRFFLLYLTILLLKSKKDCYVFRIPSMIILRLITKKFRDFLVKIMG